MPSMKSFVAAFALAASVGLPALAQDAPEASVVVLPFAVAGHGDPSRACLPIPDADTLDAAAGSNLPLQLSAAVAKQLGARPGLHVYDRLQDAPVGALVVAGCVQRAVAGNAAERLVGLNMGASDLAAHVQVCDGDRIVREFDVNVTGANKLPPLGPIGLAVHGVRGLNETLAADVVKLSKEIAEKVIAS